MLLVHWYYDDKYIYIYNYCIFLMNCCFWVTQSCPTLYDPITAACQAYLYFTISWSLLKLILIESLMPSSHLILCCLLLPLPLIFPCISFFYSELAVRTQWTKYLSFSVRPFIEYSGLSYFRIDWFDLLEVWGTLKSLLQQPQFKAISSALSLNYGPILTSTYDSCIIIDWPSLSLVIVFECILNKIYLYFWYIAI